MTDPKRKQRRSLIEVTEDYFTDSDELMRLLDMYQAKRGLKTKYQAFAIMIREAATHEGLEL